MLLLVTNTSGKHGSVALARSNSKDKDIEIIQETALTGGTFSAQLVPQIAALLKEHGFTKGDLGAFIVASGPGSFTGLRVGLAAIKALAEILHKPIVPVSLLEIVAVAGGANGKVLAALDAGRGEVYLGEYEIAGDTATMVRERLISNDEFATEMKRAPVVTPDAALVATLPSGVAAQKVNSPNAASIARVGWKKLQAGETVTPEQLDANYIRRSDAEIFAKTR